MSSTRRTAVLAAGLLVGLTGCDAGGSSVPPPVRKPDATGLTVKRRAT